MCQSASGLAGTKMHHSIGAMNDRCIIKQVGTLKQHGITHGAVKAGMAVL